MYLIERLIGRRYKESIPMGETALDSADIDELLADMSREWAGSSYDLLHKNCCHFADALCTALGVGGTPPWLNRAAHAGAGLLDGAESLKNSLRGAAAPRWGRACCCPCRLATPCFPPPP